MFVREGNGGSLNDWLFFQGCMYKGGVWQVLGRRWWEHKTFYHFSSWYSFCTGNSDCTYFFF